MQKQDPEPELEQAPFTPEMVSEALVKLEAAIAEDGWDQHASLYALHVCEEDPSTLETVPVEIPEPMWGLAGPRPYNALDMYWNYVLAPLGTPPPIWCGFVFHTEAYGLAGGVAEVTQVAEKREIHQHPERHEIRGLYAADTTGRLYQFSRRRDTDEVESTAWIPGAEEGRYHTGAIFDSVATLTRRAKRKRGMAYYRVPAQPPGWWTAVWEEWQGWQSPRP